MSKIIVATGAADGKKTVHVIDLNNPTSVCQRWENFPLDVHGAGETLKPYLEMAACPA